MRPWAGMDDAERAAREFYAGEQIDVAGAARLAGGRVTMSAKGRKGAAGAVSLEVSIEELGRKLGEEG